MTEQYKILVLLSSTQAQAASVYDNGNTKPISINGNVSMSYAAASDMEKFVAHIKGNYNIDDFSDDNFFVVIVNCGASTETLKALYGLLDGTKDTTLINASYILPFVSGRKEPFKIGDERTVRIFDAEYQLCVCPDSSIVCEKTQDGSASENSQILAAADFTFLFFSNAEYLEVLEKETVEEYAAEPQESQPSEAVEENNAPAEVKAENLPVVIESNLPAVTESNIGKPIFVEGGKFGKEDVKSFIMSSTPVTLQEWYDVMGSIPDAILGMELIRKNIFNSEQKITVESVNHHNLLMMIHQVEIFQFLATSFVDDDHEERLKDGMALIMPQAVLDNVDGDMRKEYKFIAYEDLVQDAINNYGKDVPVTHIDYIDAISFCAMKNKRDGFNQMYSYNNTALSDLIGTEKWKASRRVGNLSKHIEYDSSKNGWRLPKQYEWLYAAKGGKRQQETQYAGSNTLGDVAWYKENSNNRLHEVAQKKPNVLGLYDMCGNVCEMAHRPFESEYAFLMGGSAFDEKKTCSLYNDNFHEFFCDMKDDTYDEELVAKYNDFYKQTGFRICRTADSLSE